VEADPAPAEHGQRQPLRHRLTRIVVWLGGIAALLAVLELLGIPVLDWINDLFDKVAAVPTWAIAAGVVLESLQTSLAALAWYGILRAALPRSALPYRFVLASYAAAVALNGFLPANIGTFVMLVMFTTLIVGATFPLVISGLIVEKIPFSVFNVGLYLYLFLTVSGSFSIKLGFVADHVGAIVLIAVGGIVLLVLLARVFWERLAKLRKQLISGGAILRTPRRAFPASSCPSSAATSPGSPSSPFSSAPTASRSASTTSPPSPPPTRSPTASPPRPAASASPRR
jgi:uncharacterized membrane protein YbhN (UPF0104 family)